MVSSSDELRQRLRDQGIDTVLIGAHAANRYRLDVRMTADVDLLARTLDGAADVLAALGWSVRSVADDDGVVYLLSARRGSDIVDLLLAETEYQHVAMDRAVDGVLTVEDVIVHKLIAGRPRDRDDIASIIATETRLDDRYIVDQAKAWGVDDLWDELRAGGGG